jgi:hypothetical protein
LQINLDAILKAMEVISRRKESAVLSEQHLAVSLDISNSEKSLVALDNDSESSIDHCMLLDALVNDDDSNEDILSGKEGMSSYRGQR